MTTTKSDTEVFTKNLIKINNAAPFDDVELVYHQMCRVIYDCYQDNTGGLRYGYASNCIAHFPLTLLYLALPVDNRENVIQGVFEILINKGNNDGGLLRLNYNELLENILVSEYLQNNNVNPDLLLRYTEKQTAKLYTYFYEMLFEYSIESILA